MGYGLLGGATFRSLSTACVDTVVLSRSTPSRDVPPRFLVGSCNDLAFLVDALVDVTAVVYCAGGLMPHVSEERPADDFTMALAPMLTLIAAMKRQPSPPAAIYLSSGGTVYGRPRYLPVDETHPTEPFTSYGTVKLAGEHYWRGYGWSTGASVTVLRCANVYGQDQRVGRGQGVIGEFLERIIQDEPISVYGTPTTLRDYVHADDVATAIARLVLSPPPGHTTYNVSSGVGTSIQGILDCLQDAVGSNARIQRLENRASDGPSIVLDNGKLTRALDFMPTPLAEGIASVVAHRLADRRLAVSR